MNESPEAVFQRRLAEVTSLSNYTEVVLPATERRLNDIAWKVKEGEQTSGEALPYAIIHSAGLGSAIKHYPHDPVVRAYYERAQKLFREVFGYDFRNLVGI